MQENLTPPHGGLLRDLVTDRASAEELRRASRDLPSWTLTERQRCDLELLTQGAFSPLGGFMSRAEVQSVCETQRLPAGPDSGSLGALWPLPITLDVTDAVADRLGAGDRLVLRDEEGAPVAVQTVTDVWPLDRESLASQVYGTLDRSHPSVGHLYRRENNWLVGGPVVALEPPAHYDFATLYRSPAELRRRFEQLGWRRIVAFQTRNPMHRAHFELTLRAVRELEASLLIHPAVGMTQPGDIDRFTRVRCYRALMARYPERTAMLSLLPLAMRMAGPREALLHAIVRKNYGCSHFIVGRDHAGPGLDRAGQPFYGPYEAQEAVQRHEEELGIRMVPFRHLGYVRDTDDYRPADEVPEGARALSISGTELRQRLDDGREIPEWFTFPEVAEELRRSRPPRHRRGLTVFFTGLSGAGKSTLAKVLQARLLEAGDRPVTLLDGDIVRRHLSSELGFSREHRNLNIQRIGFVAAEITRNGGVAICAPIAPYDSTRKEVRERVEEVGSFVLVHVATPLEICEERDVKGLYAKARSGEIPAFTGISDPYEMPEDAEVSLDTRHCTPAEAAQSLLLYLERRGFMGHRPLP
ncbi:MAG: bifunctional sulfate adenylyltransferase/adenylylsulfate kinase [Acidobacteriota bacterium]